MKPSLSLGLRAALVLGLAAAVPAQIVRRAVTPPIALEAGEIRILGTSHGDVARVDVSGIYVIARIGNVSKAYRGWHVTSILFLGKSGDDSFVNNTGYPAKIYGSYGNDYLVGGTGDDYISGGPDNDRIYGGSGEDRIVGDFGNDFVWAGSGTDSIDGGMGNDTLYGQDGADEIHGGYGNDVLRGHDGDDQLFAGPGEDRVWGDAGVDTIIAVDGEDDLVFGGAAVDHLWLDTADSHDADTYETDAGYLHRISSFLGMPSPFNHTPSLAPLGEVIPDPLPLEEDEGAMISDFSTRPLFHSQGPRLQDTDQNRIGDCYLIATMGAVAEEHPEYIRKMVVHLGEGSYAVRFGGAGEEVYVRVDADLYVASVNRPLYAGLGWIEDCLWMPIIEKAWAVARKGASTYASIESGKAETDRPLLDLRSSEVAWNTPVEAADVIQWVEAGRPAGNVKDQLEIAVYKWLTAVHSLRIQHVALTVGSMGGLDDDTPLIIEGPRKSQTWRRGQHIRPIVRVLFDKQKQPIGIRLYDPRSGEHDLTDIARIYFCLSNATALFPKR